MRLGIPGGSLRLDPDLVAWHQLHSFVHEPRTFAERLAASPLFRGAPRRGWGTAEWTRGDEEQDPLLFPLGIVVTHADGILLEAFSDERLAALRRCLRGLGAGDIPADETRTFRLEAVLANPGALLQPLYERTGRILDSRSVARTWLRMAWPFLPRRDLDGRAPYALAETPRGRAALEGILSKLPEELAAIPGFPRLTVRTLRSVLLPEEAGLSEPVRRRGRAARPPRS